MSVLSFYFKDILAVGSLAGSLQDGGTLVDAFTNTILSSRAINTTGDALQEYNAKSITVAGTYHTQPGFAPTTSASDSWRSENHYNGQFDAGTWSLQVSATIGSMFSDTFALDCRLWSSVNADASGATTEITSGINRSSSQAGLGGVVVFNIDMTLGTVILTDEYLFIQLALSDNGTGSIGITCDCTITAGSSKSFLTTPNFTYNSGGPVTSTGSFVEALSI